MLEITIKSKEFYDEKRNIFFTPKCIKHDVTLRLEHSLVSISKWESFWKKPFITKEKKTVDETISYIRCMTLTQNVNPEVYKFLSNENIHEVNAYIDDPMSATTFKDYSKKKENKEQPTSELIYYWMIAFNIPSKYEKWHLNRLLNLIRICDLKNTPAKKMSSSEILTRNSELNDQRRAELNTAG